MDSSFFWNSHCVSTLHYCKVKTTFFPFLFCSIYSLKNSLSPAPTKSIRISVQVNGDDPIHNELYTALVSKPFSSIFIKYYKLLLLTLPIHIAKVQICEFCYLLYVTLHKKTSVILFCAQL